MDAKIAYLRQIPIFQNLSRVEEESLASMMEPLQKRRYTVIFRPGEKSDRLFF